MDRLQDTQERHIASRRAWLGYSRGYTSDIVDLDNRAYTVKLNLFSYMFRISAI